MTKLTLGIYPLGGATSPPVSKVSIPSKGCVVIDGYKLDGGQLAVDQAIVHPLDPAGTSAGYVSLKRLRQIVGENAGGVIFADSYEIAVQSAVADISAPPYAPGTHSYGDDELPAYPVWPDGEAEAPQEVTATADASEITDSQAEALEERIGNLERSAEQLRARDARRERAVAELDDKISSLTELAAEDQDRFINLQEQIRRRQIDDLEQEIRTLKAYMRVRSDA